MYSRDVLQEKAQKALIDAAIVFASLLCAVWLRHGVGVLSPTGQSGATPWVQYLFPAALLAGILLLLLRREGLYSPGFSPLGEFLRIVRAVALGTLIAVAVPFFYRGYEYSRASVMLFFPIAVLGLTAGRACYRVYWRAMRSHRSALRRVVIVGAGSVGRHLANELRANPGYYALCGFLDDDGTLRGQAVDGHPVLGSTADLERIVTERGIDEVILAIPSAGAQRVMELVGECLRLQIRWKFVPNLCDLRLERIHVDQVGGIPLVALRGSQIVGLNWAMKRAFDLAFAATVLLLTLPLLAVIAVAIKLTSRGPVLFQQTRIGLQGRPFTFLKFRSMRPHTGTDIHEEYTKDWIHGRSGDAEPRSLGAASAKPKPIHKIRNDPRVTPIGRLLRKTSLDELPQFWNVLRGEMSVVGPRPALPYEVERYTEWHKRRLDVLPGITGLWQVSGRNKLSFDEMVRLDLCYIETWSLEQDLGIALKTVPAVLFGRAY